MNDEEKENWEDEGEAATADPVIPVTVQGIKDELAAKESAAIDGTPEGMQFVGWMLDGWVSKTTLLSRNARPVYAYPDHA